VAAFAGAHTGRENLEVIGRLLDLTRSEARHRATELLERFDLSEAGRRLAKTYSGGGPDRGGDHHTEQAHR
jgi:ABC-type multidrug transport system ATPase subunit